MNLSYGSFEGWDESDQFCWAPIDTDIFSDNFTREDFNRYDSYVRNKEASQQQSDTVRHRWTADTTIKADNTYHWRDSGYTSSNSYEAPIVLEPMYPNYFDKLTSRTDPPNIADVQRQWPRFEDDLYTALWVRREGTQREGWCGFCSSWHKLKESAFWYVAEKSKSILRGATH